MRQHASGDALRSQLECAIALPNWLATTTTKRSEFHAKSVRSARRPPQPAAESKPNAGQGAAQLEIQIGLRAPRACASNANRPPLTNRNAESNRTTPQDCLYPLRWLLAPLAAHTRRQHAHCRFEGGPAYCSMSAGISCPSLHRPRFRASPVKIYSGLRSTSWRA